MAARANIATTRAMMDMQYDAWSRSLRLWKQFIPDLPEQYADFQIWQAEIASKWTNYILDVTGAGRVSQGAALYDLNKFVLQQTLAALPEPMRSFYKSAIMDNKSLTSDSAIALMESIGRKISESGHLYDEKYNGKFFHEAYKGVLEEADDALYKHFSGRESSKYPHLILTASHARGESEKDITDITHGIEALARDSFNGETLRQAEARTGKANHIVMAISTEPNPFLNGAQLLKRVSELRKVKNLDDDKFKHISPAAVKLAKAILQCVVTEPQLIDVNSPERLKVDLAPDAQLTLRSDAEEVAQHISLIGYSKGGNVVSDAMRFLVAELKSERHGKAVFLAEKEPEHFVPMTQNWPMYARGIVRNISLMSLAAIEHPFTDDMQDAGMRRLSVNSTEDLVSGHGRLKGTKGADVATVVKGTADSLGHSPTEAMGTRDSSQKGYLIEDSERNPNIFARRFKEFFAPKYGKAAIARLIFEGDEIAIQPSAGTTDELFEKFQHHIIAALEHHGFTNVHIDTRGDNWREYALTMHEDMTSEDNLQKLRNTFESLKGPQYQGLVIGDDVDDSILTQVQALSGAKKGAA